MPTKTTKKPATKKSPAKRKAAKKAPAKKTTKAPKQSAAKKPKLLAGGNPQIAKADGDAAVQTYIRHMPGWKQDIGRRLDDLITRALPGVRKAVRWNSPFYGTEASGWIISFHCITKYVKVGFFNGASLKPMPPVASKHEAMRYLHIFEDGAMDEKQFTDWVRQSAKLPGWGSFNC